MKSNKSKIFFREIAVLNFFPVTKIDFWPFLKLQKMEFGQKISIFKKNSERRKKERKKEEERSL